MDYNFLKTNLDVSNILGWKAGEDLLPHNIWMEEAMYSKHFINTDDPNFVWKVVDEAVIETDKIIKEMIK